MSFLLPIQLFKILADETRLGIVLLLSELGELCVCDLCTALDQSQPKISRHLALLRESGLLLDRKQGKWVHYRLSPHIPAWAAKIIDEAWRCEQEKVQAIVRNLAFLDVTGRIAQTLLNLAKQPDAMTHPDGMQIKITRQEIGQIVGCSRETVGRILKMLE
eukprot:150017_1